MAKVLHGDTGGNQLNASADKTQVYGLKGNDTLISDNKSDVLLVGGGGDDSLIVMGGQATLSGGDGADVFELNYSADKKLSAVIEDLQPSEDKIVVNFDGETQPQLSAQSISGGNVVLQDGDGLFKVTLKSVRDNDYFDDDATEQVWQVLELTNAEREAESLSPLTMSQGLTEAASIRAQEITELGEKNELDIFRHIRPNRPADNNKYETVFEEVGKEYHHHAENITAGEATAQDAVNDWMNSPTHRKNILDEEHRNYSKLGVGYNEDDTDPSDQRFYWLQLFADSLNGDSLGNPETVTAEELLNASIESNSVTKFIAGDDEPNTIENNFYGVTISALGGNDSISNSGLNVSISGGADDDTILSGGLFGTINAGTGDDQINLSDDAQEILIQYFSGGGNDSVSGLNSTDTLSISGSEFTPATVGNDIIVGVGSDSITLFGAASSGVQIEGARSKLLIGTEDADYLNNSDDAATILAKGGDDYTYNDGANVSISAGDGDDTINNSGSNVSIDAGTGNDEIYNGGENVLFFHESGNDTIGGFNETSTLKIAEGSLSSVTSGYDLILFGSTDSIKILGAASFSSINIVDANDNPVEVSDAKNIVGTEGDDFIVNTIRGATIQALGGDDTIDNTGAQVSIFGGAGNDSVNNNQKRGTVYIYDSGNDSIDGFNDSDTLDLGDYAWETVQSDNNIIVNIISNDSTVGTVTLKDYSAEVNILSTYEQPSVPGEEINNSTDSTLITGTANDDTIINDGGQFVTIQALGGNDSIRNMRSNASIDAGAGNDSIFSIAENNSIITGKGNDYVGTDWAHGTVFIYGGGNDTIDGFRVTNNFLVIEGYDWEINYYEGATVEWTESFLINVLDGSETVGTIFLPNTNSSENKWNIVSSKDDVEPYNLVIHDNYKFADGTYSGNDNTLLAGTNNKDFITNFAWRNVTIFASAGDDIIENTTGYGDFDGQLPENASIDGGTGNDYISNNGNSSTINGGAGNDTIYSTSSAVSSIIDAGAGNDSIRNGGANSSVNGGDGDDYIDNYGNGAYSTLGGANSTVNGGNGNDTIHNSASNSTIEAGDGDDLIFNWGDTVSILGGAGNDSIDNNNGNNVTILGGADNDFIYNDGSNVSILGGTGDDQIILSEESRNNFVRYADGDGNDTVWGITGNDTLNILAEPSAISSLRSGEDIIVRVGEGEILLVGARNHPPHITIGESGTSGGSGSGGSSGGGSSGTSGTSSGQGGNTSGGTSASANSNSDASGGQSASGSSGTSAASGGNGSSGRGNSSSSAAGTSITNPITLPETSSTRTRTINANPFNTSVTTTQGTYSGTKMSPLDRVYTGGNRIIQHYGSWRKITFDEIYRGAHFDGAGNFVVESSTGHLVFENATDKVINLKDAAGNDFIKAHMSSTAGTVDGRIYSGYQILNGSLGEDLIFAGADGSQLWGNADTAADTLVGGDGSDIFVGGKNEGSDTFQNASSADVVNLNDTSLSDIVSTNTRDGALVLSFNTGNTLTVQSTEALSANIIFSDGTTRRFNHATNSWQTE